MLLRNVMRHLKPRDRPAAALDSVIAAFGVYTAPLVTDETRRDKFVRFVRVPATAEDQITPKASIASATRRKPTMFAPMT